jgi:protein SCO1/2
MLRNLLVALAIAALLACKPAQFNNTDVTGIPYAQNFVLTDHAGKTRTLADFRGKLVVVFFGFTQCPDVCPTTLADMAEVRRQLGADGDKLQVLFITLDPERDTPAVLAQYVPQFDPSFIGLTGTPDLIARTAKDFKIFYQKVPGKTDTSYTVDHTAGSYVFDREGRARLFVRQGNGGELLVADLKRLLG